MFACFINPGNATGLLINKVSVLFLFRKYFTHLNFPVEVGRRDGLVKVGADKVAPSPSSFSFLEEKLLRKPWITSAVTNPELIFISFYSFILFLLQLVQSDRDAFREPLFPTWAGTDAGNLAIRPRGEGGRGVIMGVFFSSFHFVPDQWGRACDHYGDKRASALSSRGPRRPRCRASCLHNPLGNHFIIALISDIAAYFPHGWILMEPRGRIALTEPRR